ncbi:signal-regulatory protein beta-2-like [Salminus brasiliensis]|uniref:signal-regulatory protein beta-2-like n=1 Tax=Salminus brasiliensis TaxID=930266 RepID=UPI003B82DF6D
MSLIWILILSLQIIYPARTTDLNERTFISVESGKNVTLHCKEKPEKASKIWVWYKQRVGQEPQEVATQLTSNNQEPFLNSIFQKGFKIDKKDFSLTIKGATKDHEGMYFCGKGDGNTLKFFNGTFVAVTDHPQSSISIIQTPKLALVRPGDNVTLQCTVHHKVQAAERGVLWFRSAAGRSFPEIIYTHHNSSRQCEISSSKDGCVFNFTKNISNSEDTGTYYCAVSSCAKIIIGNGATVRLKLKLKLL